jgi:predicted glutamine amidotransferase
MIAVSGRFDPEAVRKALELMAANANPAHSHEKRPLGADFRHTDGWGAAWLAADTVRVRHSIHSLLEDPSVRDIDEVETDLLVLHARRASRIGTVQIENTHPFLVEYHGRPWAFCHNGVVNDIRSLHPATGLSPEGTMDSERLFHHLLYHMDPGDMETSVRLGLEAIRDFTALNCVLLTSDRAVVASRKHPVLGVPEYHTMWEGRGPALRAISSEPVDGIGCADWKPIDGAEVFSLRRGDLLE